MKSGSTKGRGKNTGVYFTVRDLELLALLKDHYSDLDQSTIMRLALRALVKSEKLTGPAILRMVALDAKDGVA